MDCLITEKKDNVLLQRLEVQGQLRFEGATPRKAEIRTLLGKQLSVDPELITLQGVRARFGHQAADIIAAVYPSQEVKRKYTVLTKHMKQKLEEEKKKAEEEHKKASEEKKEDLPTAAAAERKEERADGG